MGGWGSRDLDPARTSTTMPSVPRPKERPRHAGPDGPPKAWSGRGLAAAWRLLPFVWPEGKWSIRLRVGVALGSIAAAKGLGVIVPIFYKDAVDQLGIEGGPEAVPLLAILAYGAARLTSLGLRQVREMVFERVEQQATRRAAIRVFAHLHALPLAFHLQRKTGGLSRTIERGTRAISSLMSVALFNIVPTFIELFLVIGVLWSFFEGQFALVVGVTVIGYVAFTIVTTEWRLSFRRRLVEADREANNRAIDSLLNHETVKYFGREADEVKSYDEALVGFEEAAVKSQTSLGLLNLGQAAIMAGGLTLLMAMAAQGIVAGEMTVGDFVLVNTYLMQLTQPLNVFGWVYRSLKQSLVDMEHMFELLDEPVTVTDAPDARPLAVRAGKLSFEGVRFGYQAERTILEDLSFEALPGQTVALVGPSGAGKSTVARLLFRFWDPTGGRIRIDDVDLRQVTQSSLHSQIGIVPQDTVLFNETIGYNLRYAKPDASEAELWDALERAAVADFVRSTPEGLETLVGERGLKLSGGEKQRMAIARVFLEDPPVLVLDEATSALDTHTERAIQDSLDRVARGRTTLVIAHRLSTISNADLILVLDAGRIVERGTHRALLAAEGAYAALWAKQERVAEI